jgi:hypothetical protein
MGTKTFRVLKAMADNCQIRRRLAPPDAECNEDLNDFRRTRADAGNSSPGSSLKGCLASLQAFPFFSYSLATWEENASLILSAAALAIVVEGVDTKAAFVG